MKIKLRDMTEEQYEEWRKSKCGVIECNDECLFCKVYCGSNEIATWVKNKDLYSDKFLNQEIEIENEPILTESEKEYLSNVIKPFRDRIIFIKKINVVKSQCIDISLYDDGSFYLPYFKEGEYYKGMKVYKEYTLEELGL